MDNIELVLSCFNQHNFKLAQDNIDTLTSAMRRSTPGGFGGNKLIFDLLDVIKTYPFEEIDYPLFQEVLARSGKTPEESNAILNTILRWKQYTKEQTAPTRKMINDLCCATVIGRANELFAQDPQGYMDYIKNANIKTSESDWMVTTNFSSLDINSIVADSNRKLYHSSMEFLNLCFEPIHMLPGGQIVVISGLAGTGKSLLGAAESLSYSVNNGGRGGVPVLYYVLGDLKPVDMVIRLHTLLTGCSFADSAKDLKGSFERVRSAVGTNLELCFAPANKISASMIVDYVKKNPQFEVVIVDYDSNLLPESEVQGKKNQDTSLYKSLGDTYNSFTELTDLGKLVYIMSQPKSFGNQENTESFDMGSLGDSRKKFEIADVIVTFGKFQDSPLNIGIIKVCKNRRGKKAKHAYIRIGARFKIIPMALYEYLKGWTEEQSEPTEGDIDRMIQAYEAQYSNIKQQVQAQMSQMIPPQQQNPVGPPQVTQNGKKKGKSPFAK